MTQLPWDDAVIDAASAEAAAIRRIYDPAAHAFADEADHFMAPRLAS